jgi:STE24 endopeptidase
LSALGFVTMPAANAISRWREALADDFALRVTRRPQAFASAMTRLANQNLAEVDPERWVVALLYSHPPLRDRIRKAEDYGAQASLMPE